MSESAIDRKLPRGTLIIANDPHATWTWAILDRPSHVDAEAFVILLGQDCDEIMCFPFETLETGASELFYNIVKPKNSNAI